jgi:hypothetical protein
MSMQKRKLNIFSLSFLDAITCGFGAVILFYMIIQGSVGRRSGDMTFILRAEVDKLEIEVLEGHKNLVELRNSKEIIEDDVVKASGLSRRVLKDLTVVDEELATFQKDTLAQQEHNNQLKTDLKSLQEGNKRLSAMAPTDDTPGAEVRTFVGDGDRQYLTGLRLGGQRTLILLDASASMLGTRVVNIIRRRNLEPAQRIRARKWRQAVDTVDWILTQLPRESEVQVWSFNTSAQPASRVGGPAWVSAGDRDGLANLMTEVQRLVPENGTNLEAAFAAISSISPRPDNLILLTDGLPTQGTKASSRATINGKQRLKLFNEAVKSLPRSLPVNTVLFPMEGDPGASAAFWQLAIGTDGSYLTPTRDWP